ncbi:hypothetical protein Pmani_035386 [Petrolisthes manimaculis]|uniref:Uncharacterized protein n=1 Tax=Petrolisthes manimaculis TaxID=1843537 RepID=A0AAE1NLR8_9EUCA|nr:hypothetical protein Pmani_035386 [Petrolisthes manimaculis]
MLVASHGGKCYQYYPDEEQHVTVTCHTLRQRPRLNTSSHSRYDHLLHLRQSINVSTTATRPLFHVCGSVPPLASVSYQLLTKLHQDSTKLHQDSTKLHQDSTKLHRVPLQATHTSR